MEKLNLILFISFAAPVLMALLISGKKIRKGLLFLFIGMTVCLFCGEFNTFIFDLLPYDMQYFTSNFTPLFEEFFKAIPILLYAIVFKPNKKTLLECSVLVGVGFAVLENAIILGGSVSNLSIGLALVRGFGTGVMHCVCTLNIGYGMSFVNTKRKLLYVGTVAVLIVSIIYHSIYNTLMYSPYQLTGFLLPIFTFIPVVIISKQIEQIDEIDTKEKI